VTRASIEITTVAVDDTVMAGRVGTGVDEPAVLRGNFPRDIAGEHFLAEISLRDIVEHVLADPYVHARLLDARLFGGTVVVAETSVGAERKHGVLTVLPRLADRVETRRRAWRLTICAVGRPRVLPFSAAWTHALRRSPLRTTSRLVAGT